VKKIDTKTFKMKIMSLFTTSNHSEYQNINLAWQLITVYYVLREARERERERETEQARQRKYYE
jgi:hypothetical protein